MSVTAIILSVLSVLLLGAAIVYQKKDHVEGYGSTMGGQMVSSSLWTAAAIAAGFAVGLSTRWFWGCLAGLGIYIAGFYIRSLLESSALKNKGDS